jgi:phage terminase large subunit-like protein
LELLPDGSFRFRNVVVLVARQNGKSTLSQVLSLFFLYVRGTSLVIGTAQDLDVAEEIWQGAVDIVEETPDLDALKVRVVKVNGKKSLEIDADDDGRVDGRYKVKAANRRAGRGLSGDLILLDELREHQSWDAWGAITKTTMARADAQVWALSNAGDASSIVLRYLRKMAHAALGDPDGLNTDDEPASLLPVDDEDADDMALEDNDSLGIFEWSAPPGCSVLDRDGWAMANPAMGYTITERTIASACKTDPDWVFRTEVLCQWSDGSLEGPFPPTTWESCLDPESEIDEASGISVCVDVSWDRSTAHIAFCGLHKCGRKKCDACAAGMLHVEIVASRAGTDWVKPWLDERLERLNITGLTLQTNGAPVSSILPELETLDINLVSWLGPDIGRAAGAFYDLVKVLGLRHLDQPVLDVAAGTAKVRPLGDAWTWDRKNSTTDIASLVAATGAVWLGRRQPEKEAQPWAAYV